MPKLERQDKTLTAYAFACGYGYQHGTETKRVSLYLNHGSYELKALDYDKATTEASQWADKHGWNDPYGFRYWNSYSTLGAALKDYKDQCKRLGFKPFQRPLKG